MKKFIAFMTVITVAFFSAFNISAADSIDDIFNVDIVEDSIEETIPEPVIEEVKPVIEETIKTTLEIDADMTEWNWTVTLSLISDKELDAAKFVVELPEVVTVNIEDLQVGTIFDAINKEETFLSGTTLTISMFSANSVIANWTALEIPFTVNEETEQADYIFSINTEETVFTDSTNTELKTDEVKQMIELFSVVAEEEVTDKEEWIAQVAMILLALSAGLFAYSRKRRTV